MKSESAWLVFLSATFLFYYLLVKERKSFIKKLKRKKIRESSAILPTLKLVKDKKQKKK